ncbi:PR domain zinc finger protein 2 [Esox lucius]|uniref:PR domain containing 2, with ZNF domain b n=1 Tax=Esox lucius TaxID=8010 RepID=A0A3P9AM63_ESOLU|nr:PR domain zinc finger protein 2 [Esox lucius]XP_019911322.2 PR domain zinc finger protein 2 [Esox lucius]
MAVPEGTMETLADIPHHVWKGLPDSIRLSPSAVDRSRIGVWASRLIPKGKRFGPFVGEKKKRCQVTSNVYMWEVYFPARGWMCVDATDPMKGNWLRYVNWAHSSPEQNLFPMEVNRAIYYKVLRPIRPGEELLVWYNGEDNPEITAALEEERTSSLSKKNSPRAKRARRKLLERARQAGLGGFRGPRQTGGTKPIVTEMWDTEEGPNEEDETPSPSPGPSQETRESSPIGCNGLSQAPFNSAAIPVDNEEDGDEEEDPGHWEPLTLTQRSAQSEERSERRGLSLSHCSPREEDPGSLQGDTEAASSPPGPELEPDPDLDGDPQGDESHPCQHCERRFSTKQGLERHTHIHATANLQAHTFKCRYCGKSFGSQVGRRRHERRHENGPKNKVQRPGSLAGTATLLIPLGQADGSSPDCGSASSQYAVVGSSVPGGPVQSPEVARKNPSTESDRPFIMDENGETKELHPCKYCNKAFGTHTNMRRHQRRIHERHLLPKGVRRKGLLLQEGPSQQRQTQEQRLPEQSANASPPPVYVPSADTEDEGEYMVDISNNISENLSLYIDGKVLSTSSVSSCEVIEVDSSSAALFGLDAVIVSPGQITQAIKVDTRACAGRQASGLGQPVAKRRTSTPPLMPGLKMESETGGASSSSSTSSASALLVGSLFPQSSDSLAFQKEKTIYLSPKLKQLLQTQTDSQKPTIALIAESHRLASPLSITSLPTASGRFKRRTASPPSSPQLSPVQKADGCKGEVGGSSYTLKVPKLESLGTSPSWSVSNKEDGGDTGSPSGKEGCSWSAARSGGNSCNQQPLDLSSSISKRSDSFDKTPGEAVLDLSMSRKSTAEPESKGCPFPAHPLAKKKKPNTSMLEKVLMNEYAGLIPAGEEGSSALGSPEDSQDTADSGPHSPSFSMPSESAHPSPPSLTPVTMNPSSPCDSNLASPTPPPPVLPTMPSQDCPTHGSLPVLSPKMSPRSVQRGEDEPACSLNSATTDAVLAALSERYGDEQDNTKLIDSNSNTDPLSGEAVASPSTESSPVTEAVFLSQSSTDSKHDSGRSHSLLDVQTNPDTEAVINEGQEKSQCYELPVSSSVTESSASLSPHPAISDSPPPSLVPPVSLASSGIKEEPQHMELSEDPLHPPDGSGSSPQSAADGKEEHGEETGEGGPEPFSKSFVCNVCEDPFRSIKELSQHILEHAAEWPYKCEFCVQLFGDGPALLEHRTSLHGVGRIFVCAVCSKEFAFLCNLRQHQADLHPGQPCTHTAVESGKLRPQNYTDPARAKEESNPSSSKPAEPEGSPVEAPSMGVADVKKEEQPDTNGRHEEDGPEDLTEELYTTIKIMASEGGLPKGPDVRLGINQHYPSFKPPPFPYHNRTAAATAASATNFTTHNIPQTFSTAIRCTKCGKSFDNMPELHKHILACANASDKRRYTPKKNPIPLRQIVKPQNGVLSPASAANAGQSAFRRMGQPKRLNFNQESFGKTKMSSLSKKKNELVQKAITQKNKTAAAANKAPGQIKEEPEVPEIHVCPHCSREFSYPASLSKHIASSCPMKPVSKKAKQGAAESTPATDKNMSLRRRTTDSDFQQAEPAEMLPKPVGKTRARKSRPGPVENEVAPPAGKGKATATQMRTKRPASFPAATVPLNKKSKKGKVQSLPPTPLPSENPSEQALRPNSLAKPRVGKEVPPKKAAELKSPQQSQGPLKKEGERFSLRSRERANGPVTRSLQMANTMAPVEVKTEELCSQEAKEIQVSLVK